MSLPNSGPWFPPCRAESAIAPELLPGALRLFCLPHAGAGASTYRDWFSMLAPDVEVVAVQLPGRESRHRDPLRRSVHQLAAELTEPVMARAGGDFALFGHSMGALLGYELAQALSARDCPPCHLIVSGFRAPNLPSPTPPAYDLPDDELIVFLAELEGTSREVLAQPELLKLTLPVLRADLEVCQTYLHPPHPRLRVPITALNGQQDRGVSADEVAAWQHMTLAGFRSRLFPGGHFYLNDRLEEFIGVLKARLIEPAGVIGARTAEACPTIDAQRASYH